MVPELERSALANALDASPAAPRQDLDIAMEGNQALAFGGLQGVAAADAARDPHRALRQVVHVHQAADPDLPRPRQPPGECRLGSGPAERGPGAEDQQRAKD